MQRTIIGIDTGGTYTDAVVCDPVTHKIFASAKALTTHGDLSRGIHNALASLPSDLLRNAEAVSLSTTLATNACLENKGCRALLILFGTEPETVRKYGLQHGQFSMDDVWCIETGTHPDGTIDRVPDWNAFAAEFRRRSKGYEAFAAAEIYAGKTGAVLEQQAREIIQKTTSAPVVCGHELFHELNVLKRGANALLNARLIPVICEFLAAIDRSLRELHITAPVMIVRSDGTLMSASYAADHPIETLLCGPAASAMGASSLTGIESAIVADIGGTTSDVAFIDGKEPERVNGTVRIGSWNTFLHGLFIETFALGGDTGVSYTPFKGTPLEPDISEKPAVPALGSQRCIPICILADEYPEILPELRALGDLPSEITKEASFYEYYVFQHDLAARDYTKREEAALSYLRERPRTVWQLRSCMQSGSSFFSLSRLVHLGVLIKSSLTPTDVMHMQGSFTRYNTEASSLVISYAASAMRMTPDALCVRILQMAEFRLYRNLAKILLEKDFPSIRENETDTALLDRILEKDWEQFTAGKSGVPDSRFLQMTVRTDIPLIGIGGPAHVLVPPVAAALHTSYIIPEHAGVANALGAALGHIAFRTEVTLEYLYDLNEEEKKSRKDTVKTSGYMVRGKGFSRQFSPSDYDKALSFAKEKAFETAGEEAVRRGIQGEPSMREALQREYYVDGVMVKCIKIQILVHD